MKGRLVVSAFIGFDDLSVGDFCILDEHVYIRTAFSIRSADKPLYRKPVVGFMRRNHDRGETTHDGNGENPFPPP
jgi:hypothetical protein